jgi:hypothetical protein
MDWKDELPLYCQASDPAAVAPMCAFPQLLIQRVICRRKRVRLRCGRILRLTPVDTNGLGRALTKQITTNRL